ncbi:MAG: TonB-dependent receptor plug domain-containing protein [Prevotella sp.]
MKRYTVSVTIALLSVVLCAHGQQTGEVDSLDSAHQLQDVEVKATHGLKSRFRVENTDIIGAAQLVRAACCNLGESFTANPSVDVSYSDASTGARQIRLLGLSGTYVQMLTENVPNLRGASLPYALGYVPGPWMQSIQVSKGAASVKNGYESTTGQINVEFLKPQATEGIRANIYLDSQLKLEANADGNIHLSDRLSTGLLLHFEDRQQSHDGNGDGFMDMPRLRQYNLMNRWAYVSPRFISQLFLRALSDEKKSGQMVHGTNVHHPYTVSVETQRYEAQWKNAFILNADRNESIALMLQGSWHDADCLFGHNAYDVMQQNAYAQLMFETDMDEHHSLAVGLSLNHDRYHERFNAAGGKPSETVWGAYAQYSYKLGDELTLMPGLRVDRSSLYGAFVTPRVHARFSPLSWLTLRASAGKGYRTPLPMAENAPLMASGRTFMTEGRLMQEEAWNYGLSAGLNLPVADRTLELNAEYYYTDFCNQLVINIDGQKGLHTVSFENLHGSSFSHTFQIDATYPLMERLTATAAFRYTDARTTYDGELRYRPLTSRFKGLFTMSLKSPLELWQLDITGQLNGHGERYDRMAYPTYFQLQAQLTREFPRFSVYVGGENLTNYRMKTPIIGADNPWGPAFDATQVWGPVEGAMGYVGIRFKIERQ